MISRSLLAALSLIVAAEAAIGPTAQLTISNAQLAPDGFMRDTVVVNGQFPAPLITGHKGDTFHLNVFDALTDNDLDTVTSIHWHGLFQHGTPHADGPSFVTQCPIVPLENFDYKFQVPDQAGTYWYHSHYRNQYCDGLRGPLVVYDPNDPQKSLYDVDNDDTVITLADWYHYLSTQAGPGAPTPNTTLINGKGRNINETSSLPLAVVNVVAGKRYRFRLVSISCDTNFVFSIDGHTFDVIEVDGTSHQPLAIDSVQIYAGQRYSLVMAANQPVANYWIRALPNNIVNTTSNGINSAILRYAGAPAIEPNTTSSAHQLLNEQDLIPLTNASAPGRHEAGGADQTIVLNVTFNRTDGLFAVNNASFIPVPTQVPTLLQILSGIPPSKLVPHDSIYNISRNQVIELIIPGATAGPHPVHLHGHTFSVIKSAGNKTINYDHPPQRDVVTIGTDPTDPTIIRFVANNPGPWFFHCHIDWHLNAGFAAVFVEDQPDVANVDHPPLDWELLCPAWNLYSIINNLETGLESLKPTETTNPVNVSSLSLPDIEK
ncbi:multicopper oxidase [Peniophora sp. CONT]|nr:multicopper oxidase [Peniophora sp. CONT]